jgi:hypothetical protein
MYKMLRPSYERIYTNRHLSSKGVYWVVLDWGAGKRNPNRTLVTFFNTPKLKQPGVPIEAGGMIDLGEKRKNA